MAGFPMSLDDDQPCRSVTFWIEDLKEGSDEAAELLWKRYFDRLVDQAKRQLGHAPKRIADEEDVALSVFHSLCVGTEKGRFEQLTDREDLWKLLVVMTRMKSCNQIRHQTALKRGGRNVRGHSIVEGTQDSSEGLGFDFFLGDDPSPEFLVMMNEQKSQLLNQLANDGQRQIAEKKLHGFTNQEIADAMKISIRSVERKLSLIRKIWVIAIEGGTRDSG